MANRPRRRETRVTGSGSVNRRGSGLGTGPVGSGFGGGSSRGPNRSSGGMSLAPILVVIISLFTGGGVGVSSLLSGANTSSLSSGYYQNASYGGWTDSSYSTRSLDDTVADGSRDKYTVLKGNDEDTNTIMVYMCGADLESESGMATSDLKEMANADLGDSTNLIIYTGGANSWQNNVVSSRTNQIYQLKNGKLKQLVADDGDKAMTDPNTLSSFIQYAKKNFKASRYDLILWDHGGGSLSGYGYDERHSSSGSMGLAQIKQALEAGNTKFDFIGFDACLMATIENARMLSNYADYLIASEETEPGIGWYYTNWLNELGANPSLSTLQIGKQVCDDFVEQCNKRCSGQKTTLSITDLAELENTIPDKLSNYAKTLSSMVQNQEYQKVSTARNQTRAFATGNQVDQVDLVNLTDNLSNKQGKALASAIKSAVKYNRTSSNMTNAYGLSIYFPYESTSYVDTMVNTYNDIGMDQEYTKCIKAFASMEATGQAAYGGSSVDISDLLNVLGGGMASSNSDMMTQLMMQFLMSGSNQFLSGKALSTEDTVNYVENHSLSDDKLVWDDNYVMKLDEEDWKLVTDLDMKMYVDDGSGYIDLGLDNNFNFDDDGNLQAVTDRSWLALDGQIVPYYHLDTTDDGDTYTITGRIPCMLNGIRTNLIVVFDNNHPYGYIAGASTDYSSDTTETLAKNSQKLKDGDQLDFICDYYSYEGSYQDSYYLENTLTYDSDMELSNVVVNDGNIKLVYRFVDIYQTEHLSQAIME